MKTFTLMQATGEVVENAPVTTSEVAVETTTTQQDPASATETEQAQQGGSPWTMWIMLALIFGVMYFFMIRPQKKQQKELQKFRDSLQKGDKIVTIGGIYGTILACLFLIQLIASLQRIMASSLLLRQGRMVFHPRISLDG